MSKKVLFVCNTVMQLISAVTLRYTKFKNDDVDIIISNHINDSKEIYNRIKKYNYFNNVYHVETFKFTRFQENVPDTVIKKVKYILFTNEYLKKYININKVYDYMLCYNLDLFVQALTYVQSRKNKNFKIGIIDEGYSTYTNLFGDILNGWSQPIKKVDIVNKVLGQKRLHECIESVYLFEPELICWNCQFPINKIKKPDILDFKYKAMINNIFGYENIIDNYNRKVIFFEESFVVEHVNINDMDVIDSVCELVGKDNVIIKIHPRNPRDRFKNKGYKTNENTSIPWEVIAINNDFKNTTLVTISSGAVIMPKLLFGINARVVMLYKCFKDKLPNIDKSVEEFFLKYETIYKSNIRIIDNLSEIKEIFE